jgi:hypothetical protein
LVLSGSTALGLSSTAALAECTGSEGVNILASAGETCFASGNYISTDVIAGQATGLGSVLTNAGEGYSQVLFSTSAANTPAVQADTGGSVTLTAVPPYAAVTVTTTGDSSIGLHATGTVSTDGGPVASSISVQNANISTTGTTANGVQADSGGQVTINGGSVTTSGANAIGLYATGVGSSITTTNLDGIGPVTITTTGADSPGVKVDSGGLATLSGGSVTTSGAGSVGLWADGSGSTINASGVAATTSGGYSAATGNYANGILTTNGAAVTFSGGSIAVNGLDSAAVAAVGSGSSITVNGGASVLTTGDGAAALNAIGTGSSLTANGITVTTHGNSEPIRGFEAIGAYNGSESSGPYVGGGVMSLTNTTIVTTGTDGLGVLTQNGGVTTISGGSVSTSGESALGLQVSGTGSSITTSNGTTISTSGVNAHGVESDTGGEVTMNGGSVATSGVHSIGVLILGSGSSANLLGTTVSTSNNASSGVLLSGTGSSVTLSGVTITTTGTLDPTTGFYTQGFYNGTNGPGTVIGGGVATIANSSISTGGANSSAILTADGGTTTVNGGSASTLGVTSNAVETQGSGTNVSLTGTVISTTGNGSAGASLVGTGSSLTLSNVSITTSGTTDLATGRDAVGIFNGSALSGDYLGGGTLTLTNSSIATSGAYSFGVDTEDSGTTKVSGGSITTSGAQSDAVLALSGAQVTVQGTTLSTSGNAAKGFDVQGSGTVLTASNVSVTTTGTINPATGNHSQGLYNGDGTSSGTSPTGGGVANVTSSSFVTKGVNSIGVDTLDGGATTVNGGSVSTSGAGSNAIQTSSDAKTTINVGPSGPTSISTTGDASYGVGSNGGGVTTLVGATISTTGNGSGGLAINGAGSEIDATDVTIATTGAFDPSSGQHSYGVYNGESGSYLTGGVARLVDDSILTQGVKMYGVITANGGVTFLNGVSVTTAGQDAHALYVNGSGSQANLSGTNTFATQGAGASGVVASLGGVISATGSTTVTTSGGVSPATGFGANGIVADGAGAKVNLASATIATSGPGGAALVASDSTSSGSAGAIVATGALTIKTTNASDVGVLLQGNGASVLATGGGVITTAGNAISLTGGANQTATFDSFAINNQSGDLIFADPSVATVNFNTTTANAGANNLLDATAGSIVTLNANASTLTGVIRTDPTSTSNVNLTNGTTWTMTGSSTVTNLSVANSFVVFAPPGSGSGFKTLTVGNYVGSGANITMNATLGGSNSAADQIVVNGGTATGLTLLTVKNTGGPGGQTTGSGIPLVITTNGGTIAPGAFALANAPLVNGFRYILSESNNDWFLVSQPASTVADITNSITNVAKAQQNQIITNRVLNSVLLGATQQISSCSCGGGFASVGSFAAGAQGRWSLSDELSLIGGFSYNQWNVSGITVENAPTIAGALIYDFWKWGQSRPFVEGGGALTPYEDVNYSRTYANGLTTGVGNAKAIDRNLALFARAGWIARLTPVDEAAVYGDLGRNWMQTGGYTEMTSALNPFPATVSNGLDTLNVARLGGQYTHLLSGNIEANVSAAVAYSFGAGAGAATSVYDFGPIAPNALPNTTWMEYGARLGYRWNDRLVIDAFVVGTAFGEVGATVHGGIGLRYSF